VVASCAVDVEAAVLLIAFVRSLIFFTSPVRIR
jgi:hypothetical protein